MKKIAVIFAGQGAQFPGMGKDFYESCAPSKEIYDLAGDVRSLCFEGTKELLSRTEHTQPCVYTTSMAIWAAVQTILKENNCTVRGMAGFSLGECGAVTAAGLFSFEMGLSLVRARARWMAEDAGGKGGMCAVMGDASVVEQLAREAAVCGMVLPVNYNSPKQTVVSADHKGLERFLSLCGEHRLRAVPLSVSGPFHSPLLRPAADRLRDLLDTLSLGEMGCPVYGNLDGTPHTADTVIERLSAQVMSPVRWETTIRNMIADGMDFFLEIGPGKTLTGLMKKIDPGVTALSIDSVGTLEILQQKIKGE